VRTNPRQFGAIRNEPEISVRMGLRGGAERCPMLGWIKYLRRVRVETHSLKRNKYLASTRTLLSLVRDEGAQVQIMPLRPASLTTETVTGNDMGNETLPVVCLRDSRRTSGFPDSHANDIAGLVSAIHV
jgi:hypothetical protein